MIVTGRVTQFRIGSKMKILGWEVGKGEIPNSANRSMLEQFYSTMQATLKGIDTTGAPKEVVQLYNEAERILSEGESRENRGKTWTNAYKAEKILARIRPAASLRYELQAQIGYLKSIGYEEWPTYQAEFDALFPTPAAPHEAGADDAAAEAGVAAPEDRPGESDAPPDPPDVAAAIVPPTTIEISRPPDPAPGAGQATPGAAAPADPGKPAGSAGE